jgi:hypothetical protein
MQFLFCPAPIIGRTGARLTDSKAPLSFLIKAIILVSLWTNAVGKLLIARDLTTTTTIDVAALNVDGSRDWLPVGRINTPTVKTGLSANALSALMACVVNVESIGDGSDESLIALPVSQSWDAATIIPNYHYPRITLIVQSPGPQPTPGCWVDSNVRQNAVLNRDSRPPWLHSFRFHFSKQRKQYL